MWDDRERKHRESIKKERIRRERLHLTSAIVLAFLLLLIYFAEAIG